MSEPDLMRRRIMEFPTQSKGFVSLVFCLLGIGSLLPWNAFISAEQYFQSRLCSGKTDESVGNTVELWFGLVFNITGTISLFAVLTVVGRKKEENMSKDANANRGDQIDSGGSGENSLQGRNPANTTKIPSKHSSQRRMVYWSLSVYLLVFLATTALVLFPRVDSSTFLSLTLVGIGLCGGAMSITGTGVTAVAALFPPEAGISSYFSGQAIGALAVTVANFLAALAESPEKFWSDNCNRNSGHSSDKPTQECPSYKTDKATFFYFGLGCMFLLVCLVGFYILDRHISSQHGEDNSIVEMTHEDSFSNQHNTVAAESVIVNSADLELNNSELWHPLLSEEPDLDSSPLSDEIETTAEVWCAIKNPAISVFITLFIVITIIPAWVAEIKSIGHCQGRSRLQNDLFTPALFVIFNAGDLVGRMVAGKVKIDRTTNLSSKLLVASFSRFIFLPLFLVCKASESFPFTVKYDTYPVAVLFIFAVTNGLVLNLAFMCFPELIPRVEYLQEVGSTIMNFSLALGLLCGSFFSFVFTFVGTGHW